jgi:diphosphoinositol-polyphosphate diphosphatase
LLINDPTITFSSALSVHPSPWRKSNRQPNPRGQCTPALAETIRGTSTNDELYADRNMLTQFFRYGPQGERLVAGIVPLSSDRTQVLLIQSSSRKGWVLPKGGWEADESEVEAATREAWEEAGIHVTIERDLGTIAEQRTEAQIKKYGETAPKAAYKFFDGLVNKEEDVWPESHKRIRCWMGYGRAKESLAGRPELLEALERSGVKRV